MIKLVMHFTFWVSLCMLSISALSLKGPAITRYDPCGLALMHFEKITQKVWRGVLNFGLYKNVHEEMEIEISFDTQITLYGASQNSTFSVTNEGRDFIIKPKDHVPKFYTFYLSLNEENGSYIPKVNKLIINKKVLCDDFIKASEVVNKFNVTNEHDTKYHHMCGRRALDHAELFSVRTTANAGDWPWHVALLVKDLITNINKYQCGGNIISTTAVLTVMLTTGYLCQLDNEDDDLMNLMNKFSAGHCISKNGFIIDARRIIILAGISNLRILNEIGRQAYAAEKVILHPAFNDEQATSDLAIIKVKNIRFTEYVQPVCIWGPVYDKTKLFGMEATVVGFGTTEDNKLSDSLRSANIMVQNDSTCIAYSPEFYNSLLNEFTFCAGFGPATEINPRNGDSGGGLVVATVQASLKISWFIRGIVSKCGVLPGEILCNPKYNLVYTDVAPHYGWIYHNAGLEYRSNIMN